MNTAWIGVLVCLVIILIVGYLFLSWQEIQDRRFDAHYSIIVDNAERIIKLQNDVARLNQDNITILEKAAEFNETEMKMIEDMQTKLKEWEVPINSYYEKVNREYDATHK